jgi:hypothetical protein
MNDRCPACERGEHTSPPHGFVMCQCGDRRCNCYVAGGKRIMQSKFPARAGEATVELATEESNE